MKKKDIDGLIIRGNNVLVHVRKRKLASGLVTFTGEEVDRDEHDVFVLKTGPLVTDLEIGDKVILANVAIDSMKVDDLPEGDFIGYTPESFVKMYWRDEISSQK